MFKITPNSITSVNNEIRDLRAYDSETALGCRKVFDNLKCQVFPSIPTGAEMVKQYTGTANTFTAVKSANILLEYLEFEEVDENIADESIADLDIPEVEIIEYTGRFDFIGETAYYDMTPHQLSLVLFRELGTEIELSIASMTAGLKLKLDMLDEVKELLVSKYPAIRIEVITEMLANALAVTKLKESSSLALSGGNLAVLENFNSATKADPKNFMFLAKIGGDKTKALDLLILESAFKSYKVAVAKGDLPTTSADLNIAILKATSGALPLTEKSLKAFDGLFS